MAQPQNVNLTPLLARIQGNPLGADLLQIVEVGDQVIYRINNFQAIWYVGAGAPTFIPGQLINNLYLDNTNGNIWQFNGTTWAMIPGGGGSSIFVNGVPVVNPNFLPGVGVSFNVSGSNITISNSGVLSVNGVTGAAEIVAGTGIQVVPSGQDITISATNTANVSWIDIQSYGGLPKPDGYVNEFTTAVTIGGSPNVTIGAIEHFVNGEGVCIWEAGPATLLTTAPSAPTASALFVQGGQTITYKIIAFDDYGGLSPASSSVQVTNAPAVFGPIPQTISSISQSGGVVTVNFSTPLNTTVTAGMTIHIIGFDPGGTIPGDAIFNGAWTIASAPTTSQVTFALAGNHGSGTVSAGVTTGRVSNVQLITNISRAANGVVTVTTAQSNNSSLTGTTHPTIVIVENCYPQSLCGQWLATLISGTEIQYQSGVYGSPITGVAVANGDTTLGAATSASTATIYESISVVCPTLPATDALQSGSIAPTTCGYYIYSDSPNPGGALTLIGKTVSGNSPTTGNFHYTDWGPCQSGGYVAPGYVPITPPSAAQNQMWAGFILSGQGTTSLVMSSNVTSSITSQIQHDDAPALTAACAATDNQVANAVLMSPPLAPVTNPIYIINSPVTVPHSCNLVFGCAAIANETVVFASANQISVIPGAVLTVDPGFGKRNYVLVQGIGNPMFAGNGSFSLDGLGFEVLSNNQIGLLTSGLFVQISNASFYTPSNTSGTACPLTLQNSTSVTLTDINTTAYGRFGNVSVVGQSCSGPAIGAIWFRTTDNPNLNIVPPAQIIFSGTNTMGGRGILFDSFGAISGNGELIQLGDTIWNQGATTPTVMFWGAVFSDISISGVVNDTSVNAVLANWTTVGLTDVSLFSGEVSAGFSFVTGYPIVGLQVRGVAVNQLAQNQNVFQTICGTANPASSSGALVNTALNTSKTLIAQPLDLGFSGAGVIFGKTKVTGVTAVPSGAGTFVQETWSVQVSCVGWDGGESELSDSVNVTPNPNGFQGIAVSWNAVSGTQGYLVYLRGFRQSGTPLTTTSVTYASFANDGALPSIGASGSLVVSPLNGGTVVTPNLIIPSGYNKVTATAPTLTGNRALSLADGAQSTVVVAALSTISNGSPYTVTIQGATSSSHYSITPTNAAAALDWAAGNVYIVSKGANQVVIATGATTGETFDILATVI